MPTNPNRIAYSPSERAEIIAQFQDQTDPASESPRKMYELVPDWELDQETYGTKASIDKTQREIPEASDPNWPFVDYLTYGKIPASNKPPGKSYPYYRNLVNKFGQKLPPKLQDKLKALHIPKNPTAESAFANASPAPSGSLIPDTPATSFKYTGNYFAILTFLIPDEYKDPNSAKYDPDFHYINMHDAVFKNTEIPKKAGFNADGKFTTVPNNVTVPKKPKHMDHEGYMDKLYDKGILVYPPEHQTMRGHQRSKRLRKVVQNLFKLTIKMDNFSELSEVSRQQQVTIEEYALTTRKMFYILTFLKDQMKLIDQQESELEDLIGAMTAKTQQFERLLGKKQFNRYRQKTLKLKKDKKAVESLTKYATESILRRFKKMGISVDGVTDLDGPLPGDASNVIRWDTFKQLFDHDMVGDGELTRLKSEYMQSIQGRGERLHVLLKFPLPGSKEISELPQTKREALKVFLENAFDSLTSVPIDEGYEMLTRADYKSIGMTGGSENNLLSISIDSDSTNNGLFKNMFAGAMDIDEHDIAVVNYNNLYGGLDNRTYSNVVKGVSPRQSGDSGTSNGPSSNNPPGNGPSNGPPSNNPPGNGPPSNNPPGNGPPSNNPPGNGPSNGPPSNNPPGDNGNESSLNNPPEDTGSSSDMNPNQTGSRMTEDGFILYLQGVTPSQRAEDSEIDETIKEKYLNFLKNEKNISGDSIKIEIIEGYDDTPIRRSEDESANIVVTPPPGNGPPSNNPPGNGPPSNNPPGNGPPSNNPPGNGPPSNNPPGNGPPSNNPPGNGPPSNNPPGNGPPSNNPPGNGPSNGSTGGRRLYGGDVGLGIKVNGLTQSQKDIAQKIVDEGEIPDDLRNTYNLYLSRPMPVPGKTLNLPYEPSKSNQLEVVIKLPNDPVKKQQVLETFGKKQILSRLKQNLAARLGNYKEYQTEYKDIKDLLHNMATNSNWIKDMTIESLGETSGIKVNPNQPTQKWKDIKSNIQQFNTKLLSSISADDYNNLGDESASWRDGVTEGTEGHISKGLFEISKFDDEIADRQSGQMVEYKINFADAIFAKLDTQEKREDFLRSLGIDPSKIKNPNDNPLTGGKRSKKNKSSKKYSKKNKKFGGAPGEAVFVLDLEDIKDRIKAAKSLSDYTFTTEEGEEITLNSLNNAIKESVYDPKGEELRRKESEKAAREAAEASRKAAEEAASAAEELQKKVEEAESDTTEIEFGEAEENIHLAQAASVVCMLVEKNAPEDFINRGIQQMADSATNESLKQKIKDIDITKCSVTTGGYMLGGYKNIKRKSNKKQKYFRKKQRGGDPSSIKIPASFLKFLEIEPQDLAQKTKEFTQSHQDIIKDVSHVDELPTEEQFDQLKPTKIPCACDNGEVVDEGECPEQGGQQCKSCDESQSYELIEDGSYKKCIQKKTDITFTAPGDEAELQTDTVEGVLQHQTMKDVIDKSNISSWGFTDVNAIILTSDAGKSYKGDDLTKPLKDIEDINGGFPDAQKLTFAVSKQMTPEQCVSDAKGIIGLFAKWDTGIRNILKGWAVKVEPDGNKIEIIHNAIDDLNNQGDLSEIKKLVENKSNIQVEKVMAENKKIQAAMETHVQKIKGLIEASQNSNKQKTNDITMLLNKPPSRNEAKGGIPIDKRLADYYTKLGEFSGYTRTFLGEGADLYDKDICISLQNVVVSMKEVRGRYIQWSAGMADDLEDIGGAVRTVVKYRDHHLSGGEKYPIVEARVKKKGNPQYVGDQWLVGKDRENNISKVIPTCIFVDNKGSNLQDRISCSGYDITDPDCEAADKKADTIKFNKEQCEYLVTPGITTNRTRFYGPFADVFDETNSNFDVYQRMEGMFDQLSRGYNVTIFGFGFSGSGKTYTLLGQSDTDQHKGITQQAITALSQKEGVKILCKVKELAPGHTHSRIIYYKTDDSKFIPSTEKNPSWKWKTKDGQVVLGETQASVLTQGTTFTEVTYDEYKNFDGFTIKPEEIDNLVEKITLMRVNTLRISGTPNNPQSSRGHLFLEFNVNFGENKGKLTICDMAGSEDTKAIKDAFFSQSMIQKSVLDSYKNEAISVYNGCPAKEGCGSVSSLARPQNRDKDDDKKTPPEAKAFYKIPPKVYGSLYLPNGKIGKQDDTVKKNAKVTKYINGGAKITFNNLEDYHANITFYFPHDENAINPKRPLGLVQNTKMDKYTTLPSAVAMFKNNATKTGATTNAQICPKKGLGDKENAASACGSIESYVRTLWVKYGKVFNVKDAKGGNEKEKFGYYEKSIWSTGDVDDKLTPDILKDINYKQTYYNATDIWSQFYLKFMFGNDIKQEHFYHCLPEEITGNSSANPPVIKHPDADNEKKKGKAIIDSVNNIYDHIYAGGSYNPGNIINLESDHTKKPYDDDYIPPIDGGIDKIQIASEMKPKLVIPSFLGVDCFKSTKNSDAKTAGVGELQSPIDALFHTPFSLASIDTFLAVNGLVSPYDIEKDVSYGLPTVNLTDPNKALEPLNKVIAIFDSMVKKIEPMSGKELAMKKQWVLLRDMYIVSDGCKWEKSKETIVSPLTGIFKKDAKLEDMFNPNWLAGKASKAEPVKFKQLVLDFDPKTGLSTKPAEPENFISFHNIQYLYSAINNFILNYITIIVYQGDGIVATLDHLATYFRYNNFDTYGKKDGKLTTCVEIDGPGTMRYTIPGTPDQNEAKHKERGEPLNPFALPSSKKETPGWDIGVTKPLKPTENGYPGSRGVRKADRPRDAGQRFLMYNTLKSLDDPNSISKYIMLTCILRGEKYASTQGKYCKAAKDTLEFAQKVASTASSCLCEMPEDIKSIAEGESEKIADRQRCSQNGGRRIRKRSLKKKKYMKVNNKRTMRRRKKTRN